MPDNRVSNSPPAVSRRKLLQTLGVTLAIPRLAQLTGCSSDPGGNPSGAGATGGTDGTSAGGAGGASGTGGGTGGSPAADASTIDAGGWATGGTASMRGNYPDPFAGGLGNACKLTCAAILGPCYAATIERKDITEGHDGLPVRLAFLIVDESCQPIPGAAIDIWHVSPRGVYSGNDSVTMCTLDVGTREYRDFVLGLAERRVSGGAAYDALVAATVASAGGEFVSCDRRALPIYEQYGVRVDII